ncbi:MAG TPA: hypothetical protein VGI54_00515 [Solirubrobacteraceae bacterium]
MRRGLPPLTGTWPWASGANLAGSTKADPAATGKQILKEASAGIPDNAEASDGFAAALSAGG